MNRSSIFRPAWLRGLSGRVVMLLLVVLFLSGATSHAGVAPVVRTIAVGTAPVAMDMDTTTGRAFVVNQGSNTVSVLDTRTGILVRTVAVGRTPVAVAVDRQRHHVLVVDQASNTLSVLDSKTGALRRVVPVGRGPTAGLLRP